MRYEASGATTQAELQPSTRQQNYMTRLEFAYRDFLDAVEDLDERAFDTKWLDGRWGVRELAAHIAGWHGQFSGGIERLSRGEPVHRHPTEWHDVDGLNQTFAEHAKGKRKAEILLELECAVDSFRQATGKLENEQFDEKGTVAGMFRTAGYDHFREHTDMIRNWRQSRPTQ